MTQTVQKAGEHLHVYSSIHGFMFLCCNISPIQEAHTTCPDGSYSLPTVTNTSMFGSSEELMVSCFTTVLRYYFY